MTRKLQKSLVSKSKRKRAGIIGVLLQVAIVVEVIKDYIGKLILKEQK